jgi:glycosyltransferase involved in cell wall biosynthesis
MAAAHPSRLAYISFDTVPAPKGAAIHIAAFAKALAQTYGALNLVTVSPKTIATHSIEVGSTIAHTALPALGNTLIARVLYFRQQLGQWFQTQPRFDAIQIRSIYEGFPIAQRKSQLCDRLIFEVNGLPSIELKYRYPAVAEDKELQQKLLAQEQVCLDTADQIITPSSVTQVYLEQRGVPAHKIQVIPNGVDLDLFRHQLPSQTTLLSPLRLLYFGTLSSWQGVTLALEALGFYCRDFPAELTVVAAAKPSQIQALQSLAAKLGVGDRLTILEPLSQSELVMQMHQADAIVAPLTANDRNLIQGCCPLKVLEGMASGTPVITSELPVVEAIATHEIHALLVKSGSAKAIRDAMLKLRQDALLRSQLSRQARQHIEQNYTWERANQALVKTYQDLDVIAQSI